MQWVCLHCGNLMRDDEEFCNCCGMSKYLAGFEEVFPENERQSEPRRNREREKSGWNTVILIFLLLLLLSRCSILFSNL